eukprot:COSAG06_NODE_1428_length_9487_cov_195.907861_15_plen_533_part_00
MLIRRGGSAAAGSATAACYHRRHRRCCRAALSDLATAEDAARATFRVQLRPLQRAAVAAALRGDSFLFVSPTASGKSLCFQLPAAVQPAGLTTLVVSPLLALMQEQVLSLRRLGIDAVELHSSGATSVETLARATAPPRLIYTTPEWLVRHHTRLADEAGIRVGRLVVDEAHCLSEWGAASGFRSEYLQLGKIRSSLAAQAGLASATLPVSCFTATATEQVRWDIVHHLGLPPLSRRPLPLSMLAPELELEPEPEPSEVGQSNSSSSGGGSSSSQDVTLLLEAEADRPNLELHVTPSPAGLAGLGAADQPSEQRLIQALAQEICRESVSGCQQSVATARHPPRTIVFCITRADAERISSGLARLLPLMTGAAASGGSSGGGRRQVAERDVASVGVYHSGLSEAARRKAARQWARGITRVLIATPAVGLGASAKQNNTNRIFSVSDVNANNLPIQAKDSKQEVIDGFSVFEKGLIRPTWSSCSIQLCHRRSHPTGSRLAGLGGMLVHSSSFRSCAVEYKSILLLNCQDKLWTV